MNTMLLTGRELPLSFIRNVKARLAKLNADDVQLRPEWSSLDEHDESFTLKVPVSAELVLPVRARHDFTHLGRDEEIKIEAADFAAALITLSKGRAELSRYARSVRDEALRVVEKARSNGIDVRFVKVDFKPALAHFLGNEDYKEGLAFVFAEVHLSILQGNFGRTTVSILVEEIEDLESDLAGLIEEQEENQSRMDALFAGHADADDSDMGAGIIGRCGFGAPASLSSI